MELFTNNTFQQLQYKKDFLALFLFSSGVFFSQIHGNNKILLTIFSTGFLLDSAFSLQKEPWTITRTKDLLGALGMGCFVILLLLKPPPKYFWIGFFMLAFAIDFYFVVNKNMY